MRERTPSAIIYARVSTSRQADDGLPVDSQLDQCQHKATQLGAVVRQIFRDDGISGRTSNRPGFIAALDYCDAQRIDYFICWSSSRFARNHIDAALNKRLLDKIGTRLVFVSQDFGESDEAWMIESIVAIMDEQYSRAIAKDTRRSMAKNAEDGFWNGGHIPFGFRPVAIGKRRRLEQLPDEADIVKRIFRWSLEGQGSKAIAERLNASGIHRRGKKWSKASVAGILGSQAVVGKIVFHSGEQTILTVAHDPIIDQEVFDMANAQIAQRAPEKKGGTPRSTAVFSGILHCGHCGQPMMTECATSRSGKRYHYYNCRNFLKGSGCQSHRVPVDGIDGWLIDAIADRIFTPENLTGIVRDIKQNANQWARDHQRQIDAQAKELAGVEKRLQRLYETIEAGAGLELADIAPRLRELRAKQKQLSAEIDRLTNETGPESTMNPGETAAAAKIFREILQTAESPSKIREFLQPIVAKINLDNETATIEYHQSRLVNARAIGSHSEVRWLPDATTLRTAVLSLRIPPVLRRAA